MDVHSDNQVIHVYAMPGLAASSKIFEYLSFQQPLKLHLLDWFVPEPYESLSSYAQRMSQKVVERPAVLMGVSFGGILVQEMKPYVNPIKTIIISSVKTKYELSTQLKFARQTKAYKILPTGLLQNVELLTKYAFGEGIQKRLKLYEKYLSIRDKAYLDWAIEQVICWDREHEDKEVIHIHGSDDEVFPVKNIQHYIPVVGGTHIMILNKYKWMNENLPKIILENQE